jgi:TRAP transporter TatT component family protein
VLGVLLAVAVAAGPAPAGAAVVPADPGDAALTAGQAAFAGRGDPLRLDQAIARFSEAARLRPADPAPLLALARAHAFRAEASPGAAREAWGEAARAAERALRLVCPGFGEVVDGGGEPRAAAAKVDARGAEALYWLALAAVSGAKARGMAALLAIKDEARALMERAAELDEQVDGGGPRRALGAWLATLPSAAGGGATAARRQLERARALRPDDQRTKVVEAETLAVLLQDRARFEALLSEVLAFDSARAPALGPENALAKRRAHELLERKERLF